MEIACILYCIAVVVKLLQPTKVLRSRVQTPFPSSLPWLRASVCSNIKKLLNVNEFASSYDLPRVPVKLFRTR